MTLFAPEEFFLGGGGKLVSTFLFTGLIISCITGLDLRSIEHNYNNNNIKNDSFFVFVKERVHNAVEMDILEIFGHVFIVREVVKTTILEQDPPNHKIVGGVCLHPPCLTSKDGIATPLSSSKKLQ